MSNEFARGRYTWATSRGDIAEIIRALAGGRAFDPEDRLEDEENRLETSEGKLRLHRSLTRSLI